jgi:hypothetical protein
MSHKAIFVRQAGSGGKASGLYSVGDLFDSRLRHLVVFVVLSPSSKTCHGRFYSRACSYHSVIILPLEDTQSELTALSHKQ